MGNGRICGLGLAMSCVALASITTATAREAPATEVEKEAATRAYVECKIDKAKRLDDGISDAISIGAAIASACRPEMETVAGVLAKGEKRDRVRLMLIDRLANHAVEDAAAVVLLERRKRANVDQDSTEQRAAVQTSEQNAARQSAYIPKASREAAAREQLMTGADLNVACNAIDDEWSKCSAFIRGVMYAYRAGVLREGGRPPYCLPERFFAFEWTGDVVEFLNAHPDFADAPAQSAVIVALEAKYPCKSS